MAGKSKNAFVEKPIKSWKDFKNIIDQLKKGKWIYRGQTSDKKLRTRLERENLEFKLNKKNLPVIEFHLIREFRRRYEGIDRDLIMNDTLYCLALMQHHGAPTRLLDCTYSPFVAAFFALESSPNVANRKDKRKPASVIWCFNQNWLDKRSSDIENEQKRDLLIQRPNSDKARADDKNNFIPLYMPELVGESAEKFVSPENPILLNKRLIVQKGIFLCPGSVSEPFVDNLKAIKGWNEESSILKLRLNFSNNPKKRIDALNDLHDMNIDNSTLFPGLDGFAQSLKLKLPRFHKLQLDRSRYKK